jgi:hypothetical protein
LSRDLDLLKDRRARSLLQRLYRFHHNKNKKATYENNNQSRIFTACVCWLAPLSAKALEFAGYLRSGIGNSLEGGKQSCFSCRAPDQIPLGQRMRAVC